MKTQGDTSAAYLAARIKRDAPDQRREDTAKAEADGAAFGQGSRTDLSEHRALSTMLDRGTTHASHVLRRLARNAPDVLAAYKRGEFKSAAPPPRVFSNLKTSNPAGARGAGGGAAEEVETLFRYFHRLAACH